MAPLTSGAVPTLSFEGETHDEIVRKVRRWLASVEGQPGSHLSAEEAIERASELTKDALSVIATAAPRPVAENELVKKLTERGYGNIDATKRALKAGLGALHEATGGGLVRRVEGARRAVVYEMNATVARQVLKALRGG